MRIRNKLNFAMAVPIGLLILQVVLVNHFVRELQSAINYISSANSVIERNFIALEKLALLRNEIKQIPARFVGADQINGNAATEPANIWAEISSQIEQISKSDAFKTVESTISQSVINTQLTAETQIRKTVSI